MTNYFKKDFIINSLIVLTIFFLDRISKLYVIFLNEKNLSPDIFTSKFLNINLIWNEGIAFGLLSFNESYLYNLLTFLISIIIIVIFFMIMKNDGIKKYSLLMILGVHWEIYMIEFLFKLFQILLIFILVIFIGLFSMFQIYSFP